MSAKGTKKNVAKTKPASAAQTKLQPEAAARIPAHPDAAKSTPGPRAKVERKPSALNAAVAILKEAKQPMTCADITKAILQRKLWSTAGKTPAATINAAMIREIQVKGRESRFKKAGRGLFAIAG